MKNLLSSVALAAAALFTALPASAAIVVSFHPSATQIAVGGLVNVEMRISGLGDEILSAFDIDATFNSGVLSNFAVTHNAIGTQFGPLGDSYFDANFGAGVTEVIDGSLLDDATLVANQDNDFVVLTFGFNGLADGVSTITLGPDLDFERNFVGLGFQSLDVEVGSVCIAVGNGNCAVPEPASYGLAAIALLAAGAAGRTRRRREVI